jgi:hypothetical protein
MKCVACGHDSRRRERGESQRCPRCSREFALDPTVCGITDLAFQNALNAISEHGRLAWTPRHLYYELARWRRRRSLFARLSRRAVVRFDWHLFESVVRDWQRVHGFLPGRLPTRAFADPPPDDGGAPDVADYGFERIVVCDSQAIVDVLLANSFHVEHRTPVFSADGYPEHAFERASAALRRDPPALVVAVHHADPEGCALAERVADDPRWFAGNDAVRVLDAGLRPGDARNFRGLFDVGSSGPVGAGRLTEREEKWLRRYRLDLHALRPRRLLLALAGAVATPVEELTEGARANRPGAASLAPVVFGDEWGWWSGAESDDDYPG